MATTCVRCATPLKANLGFCPKCGADQPGLSADASGAPVAQAPAGPLATRVLVRQPPAAGSTENSPAVPDYSAPAAPYAPGDSAQSAPYVPYDYSANTPSAPSGPDLPGSAAQPARQYPVGRWLIGLGLACLLIGGFGIYLFTRNSAPPAGLAIGPTRTPRPERTPGAEATAEPTAPDQTPGLPVVDRTPAPTRTPRDRTSVPLPPVDPATIKRDLPAGSGNLIYVSSSTFELVAAPASGGPEQTLVKDPKVITKIRFAPWSPDGKWAVIYEKAGSGALISVVEVATGQIRQVGELDTTVPHEFYWSPDSSKVAFVPNDDDFADNTDQDIWLIDVATEKLSKVTAAGSVETYTPLVWAPDSSEIAYVLTTDDVGSAIKAIRPDGSNDRVIVEDYASFMSWLPADRLLLIGLCGNSFNALCTVDPQGGEPEVLHEISADYSPEGFSPDGKWLMLGSYVDDSLQLLNIETGKLETVGTPPAGSDVLYFWAGWSPDGKYVTYRPSSGVAGITYVYEPGAGQPARPLTSDILITWLPEK